MTYPEDFKGTPGDLELKYVSNICIGIGTVGSYSTITANSLLPDSDKEYELEKEHIIADMTLYAAAPKLLKALIDLTSETMSDFNFATDTMSPAELSAMQAIESALIPKK